MDEWSRQAAAVYGAYSVRSRKGRRQRAKREEEKREKADGPCFAQSTRCKRRSVSIKARNAGRTASLRNSCIIASSLFINLFLSPLPAMKPARCRYYVPQRA